jgi:hypothetical protein
MVTEMAKAPLRRGGSEESSVAAVAKGNVVVIALLSSGKEVTLNPDKGARGVEREDRVTIDYFTDPDHPAVKFFRAGEEIHTESVPVGNIRPIVAGLF